MPARPDIVQLDPAAVIGDCPPIRVHNEPAMEKAYTDVEFLKSRHARILRILSEYREPQSRFARYHIKDTIVLFGSARTLDRDKAMSKREGARGGRQAHDRVRRAPG